MHYCLGISGTTLMGDEQRIPSRYKVLLKSHEVDYALLPFKMQWGGGKMTEE